MKTFIRLMPVLVACVATQAFASNDPPTPAPVESAKPSSPTATPAATTTPTATADRPAATAPAPAGQRLVLEDKTLTNTEVQRLLSQGYKPQKGRNETVLYCREEPQLGTHFSKKVCMTADQIKQATLDSSDLTRKFQQNQGTSGK